MNLINVQAEEKSSVVIEKNYKAEALHPVMGETTVTIGQMINYYLANASYPQYYEQCGSDAPNIYEFCKIYMEECRAEGVRAEVAFCQAMKETGFLRFTGDVRINQFNFAGLGATGGGNPGNSFLTVRLGIRAQVQHLKAYASTASLVNPCVDPRFFHVSRGCAPYVEWLGQHENPAGKGWATAINYGYSVVRDYMNKLDGASRFTTWYQGRDYSLVYNPDYYMMHNPDVVNAVGYNSDALIAHFVTYGMREGRSGNTAFDVQSYKNQYVDLRCAYGNDLKAYYFHYMNYGAKEGRNGTGCVVVQNPRAAYGGVDYSVVYDYNYYISAYPDIKNAFGNDDEAVLEHFITYGMREGRQGNSSFNVTSYLKQYEDLRRAFGSDLKSYYLHYINYGRYEGRQGIGCDVLQNAITSYNGIDYSAVYDYNYYINTYDDLRRAFGNDDAAVLKHFVDYGMNEGRQAKAEFNVYAYRDNNPDLQNAFGNDLKSYYLHYINYGRSEGRRIY